MDFGTHAARDFIILVDCYTVWSGVVHMGSNTTTPRLLTPLK